VATPADFRTQYRSSKRNRGKNSYSKKKREQGRRVDFPGNFENLEQYALPLRPAIRYALSLTIGEPALTRKGGSRACLSGKKRHKMNG